jgi:hypothetical protein
MRIIPTLLAVAACVLVAQPAAAGDCCDDPGCCDQACCGSQASCNTGCGTCCGLCGCKAPCNAYCVVECGTDTVARPCFKVECEPFCLPLPRCCKSCCGGCGCKTTCGCCVDDSEECGCPSSCCHRVPVEKMPRCGKVRMKKKLFVAECEIEVPKYSCVVRYCCPSCCRDPGCCGACRDPGCCDPGCGVVEEEQEAEPQPAPAPDDQAWDIAPLPPAL